MPESPDNQKLKYRNVFEIYANQKQRQEVPLEMHARNTKLPCVLHDRVTVMN